VTPPWPSEVAKSLDSERHYRHDVEVWRCRNCGEVYDYLPRVANVVECVECGSSLAYLRRERIND
jgi:uncharacterized protein with PIN domain